MLALGLGSLWSMAFALLVFFVAFNVLEAMLPSLISKAAPARAKGTALGVYRSVQFLGTFVGAAAGGWHLAALRRRRGVRVRWPARASWLVVAAG